MLIPISGAIFSCIGFLLSNSIRDNYSTKTRALDKNININFQKASKLELEKRNFQLRYKDKPFYSYASITIEVYNYTDKNYSKVPIHINIASAENDTLALAESIVVGSDGFEESVKTINSPNDSITNKLSFSYSIEVANSADTISKYIFLANFLVLCKEKPEVKISLEKDGLSTRQYNYTHFNISKWYQTDLWFWIFFFTTYVIILVLLVKVMLFLNRERSKKWRKFLRSELDLLVKTGKIELDADSIIKTYSHLSERFDFQTASLFIKWLKQLKDPDDPPSK